MLQYLRQKLLRAVAAGLAEEIVRQRVLDDFALVHEDDPVGDLAGKTHFVGHDHHGHAVRGRSTMTSSTSLIISGSSAEVGSSNSMAIGSIAKRARDRHALLLAAGQFGRIFLRLNLEADAVEQLGALRQRLGAATAQHLLLRRGKGCR